MPNSVTACKILHCKVVTIQITAFWSNCFIERSKKMGKFGLNLLELVRNVAF